ncbi:MAG: hypothetical protein Kow0096_01400 [Thiohalomonadaceae bacterium]
MVQTIIVQGIDQGAQHMLLPHHGRKGAGTPFAGQDLITHGRTTLRYGTAGTPAAGAGSIPDRTTAVGKKPWRVASRASHTPAPESTVTAAPFRA